MEQILKNKPKRPVNSYLLWLQENKERILEENEEYKSLTFQEKNKKMGELYEALDEQIKDSYKARAKKEADEYKEILEKYYLDNPGLKEYEEQQKQDKKDKKSQKQNKQEKIPVKLQFNDSNLQKMIQVSVIKKYHQEQQTVIKNDRQGRKYLNGIVSEIQNDETKKQQWQEKWESYNKEQREQVIEYFKDWQETTKEVKQTKEKQEKNSDENQDE